MCYFSVSLANLCSCMLKAKWKRFYTEVSSPVQGVCRTLKRFGGRWLAKWKVGLDLIWGCIEKFHKIIFFSLWCWPRLLERVSPWLKKLNKQNSPPPAPQTSDHLHFFIVHLPGLWWRQIHLHGFLHTKKLPYLLFWNQVKLLSFCSLFKLKCFWWYMCLF